MDDHKALRRIFASEFVHLYKALIHVCVADERGRSSPGGPRKGMGTRM